MFRSKQANRETLRIGVMLALIGAVLAGCAPTPGPKLQAPQPSPVAPWTAAIGELDAGTEDPHCSAVLVEPDLIATAAHCLFLNNAKAAVRPGDLVFRPNLGGLPAFPPSRGIAFRGLGGVIRGGKLRNEDVPNDWALITVSPPVVGVQPLPVASLPISGMLRLVQSGDRLVTAGYGNGAYDELRLHSPCRIIPQSELGMFPDDTMLITSCIFRVGDSGGPILLVDGAGEPALIGIISGFGRKPHSTEPVGIGVNAGVFLPYIGPGGAPKPGAKIAATN